MAIAYGARVGSNHANTNGATQTVTTSANVPAGSTIVVSVSASNVGDLSNLTSVTDSAGNTYASGGFTCDPGQNTLTAVWYSTTGNALASASTVTVTFHTALLTSGESWEIAVDYLTGGDTTATPLDGTNGKNSQTGATWITNSITTTNAADLVWVAAGTNQGAPLAITNAGSTPTTGWTTLATISGGAGNNNQLATGYQVFSATGTYQGGGTDTAFSNGTSAVIIAFKAASGGGGGVSLTASPVLAKAVTTAATLSIALTLAGSPVVALATTQPAALSVAVALSSTPALALATTQNAALRTAVTLTSSPAVAVAVTAPAALSVALALTTAPVLALAVTTNAVLSPGGGALHAQPAVAIATTTNAALSIALALSASSTLATAVTPNASLLLAVTLTAQAALAVASTRAAALAGASIPGSVALTDALAHVVTITDTLAATVTLSDALTVTGVVVLSDALAAVVTLTDALAATVTISDSPAERSSV